MSAEACEKGSLSDTQVLLLALSGVEGMRKAYDYYCDHILPRYGLKRSYEGNEKVIPKRLALS